MTKARSDITKLRRRDGDACHYCRLVVHRSNMTRDHVFPRSMGGPDSISNYVLACGDCNSQRGNNLFFCKCYKCVRIIQSSLRSSKRITSAFTSMMRANKPRVYKNRESKTGAWLVSCSLVTKQFPTYQEALAYLLENNYSLIQEPVHQ